ncbi:MAG: hypothetical protein IBJ02_04955 [Brevundimonas sp.]|nr:hypothetical protein [Brevundimonas sp.]
MSNSLPSSDEKLRELATAIDRLDQQVAPPVLPARAERPPKAELGPRTRLSIQIMTWFFRLFWGLWILLFLIVAPPQQISDLIVVPFSALVCWLIFQFHKAILVAAARKMSASR